LRGGFLQRLSSLGPKGVRIVVNHIKYGFVSIETGNQALLKTQYLNKIVPIYKINVF
jgi:hypothetical protein